MHMITVIAQSVHSHPAIIFDEGLMTNKVTWADFPKLNEDTIIVLDKNGPTEDAITFVLMTLSKMWSKEIHAYNVADEIVGMIKTDQDNQGPISMTVPLKNLARIELCKAKGIGIMTGIYRIEDFSGKNGHTITFQWSND